MPIWLWIAFIGIGVFVVVQSVRQTKGKRAGGGYDGGVWYGGADTGLVRSHHPVSADNDHRSDSEGASSGDGDDGGDGGGDGGSD